MLALYSPAGVKNAILHEASTRTTCGQPQGSSGRRSQILNVLAACREGRRDKFHSYREKSQHARANHIVSNTSSHTLKAAGRLDIFHSYCEKCHYASEYNTWAETADMFRARFENVSRMKLGFSHAIRELSSKYALVCPRLGADVALGTRMRALHKLYTLDWVSGFKS